MPAYAALLRAVNLGPHNKVAMGDLRAMAEDLGLTDVSTLLQSGNLVFRGTGSASKLEATLEREAERRLGLRTEFMVRTAAQWKKIVAANPFPKEAKTDPGHVVIMACKKAPPSAVKTTGAKRERVEVVGGEVYVWYPDGIGRSKLRIAGVVGTARNWNTVLKIASALGV